MADLPDHSIPSVADLQGMTEDRFLVAWNDAALSADEGRLKLFEECAQERFPVGSWKEVYVKRFPDQVRYQLTQ